MGTVFAVRAAAGKRSFSVLLVSERPLVIRAEIPAKPLRGEANRALLSYLGELLGCKVEILSGKTGRKKTLAADCTFQELVQRIREHEKFPRKFFSSGLEAKPPKIGSHEASNGIEIPLK